MDNFRSEVCLVFTFKIIFYDYTQKYISPSIINPQRINIGHIFDVWSGGGSGLIMIEYSQLFPFDETLPSSPSNLHGDESELGYQPLLSTNALAPGVSIHRRISV